MTTSDSKPTKNGYTVTIAEMVRAYQNYCFEYGIKPMSGIKLGKQLYALGLEKGRDKNGRYYIDVRLKNIDPESFDCAIANESIDSLFPTV